MNIQLSFYLDLIRFISAVLVFISHVPPFIGGYLWQIAGLGHESVVVFFVLSGFVMAFVCYERNESCFDYVVNRISRIYSVAIPSILITLLIYYFLYFLHSDLLEGVNQPFFSFFRTVVTALTFTNQSWFATTTYINLPYWSMGYEVLYYIFFGFLFYARGFKRLFFLSLVLLVMGPSVVLYLPIWLAGVFCFKLKDRINLSERIALYGFVTSIVGIILCCFTSWQVYIDSSSDFFNGLVVNRIVLATAKHAFSDYVLTFFVCINIVCASAIFNSKDFRVSIECRRFVKNMSSHTFCLYLMHMPLLYLVQAIVPSGNVYFLVASIFVVVPVVIFIISSFIEKERPKFRSALAHLFGGLLCNSRIKCDSI